ncbi:MAG: hypothetical protein ACRD4U_05365 [Candidatus Acidiferrales bacterium]
MALVCLGVLACLVPAGDAQELTAQEIVARLQEANRKRDELLASWQVTRRYHLKNELSEKETKSEVEVRFEAPAQLTFTTRSQEGSGTLARQVFGRMMDGEKESVQPEGRQRSAMTPENYQFRLVGREMLSGRPAYKLAISPKREDTFLIDGHIWVDAEDFAVVRGEGRVVKRPSFWTRSIQLVRTFKKVGPFWLPHRTESTNEVLLFGTTWVTIENGDYRVRLKPGAQAR